MFQVRGAVAVSLRILCKRSFSSSVTPNRLLKSTLACIDRPDIWYPPPSPSGVLPRLTPAYNEHKTTEIDGKLIANDIKATLATEVSHMKSSIRKAPRLGIILVRKRKDSLSFVHIKKKACEEVGIASVVVELPEDCTEGEVLDVISVLNHKESVHGMLVQLPLPSVITQLPRILSSDPNMSYRSRLNIENLYNRNAYCC